MKYYYFQYITNTHRQSCPFSINTLNFMRTLHQKSGVASIFHDLIVCIFFFVFPIKKLRIYLENPVYLYYATSYLLTAFNGSAFSSAKDIKKILDRARTNEVDDDLAQQGHQ